MFLILFALTLTLIAYLSGLHGVFTYDDYQQILLRDKLHNIFEIRDVVFCGLRQNRLWQNLSIALNWTITPNSTVSFKTFGLLLHLLNSSLLFLWLRRFLGTKPLVATLTTAIFLVHPLQTQSVTYAMGVISLFQGFFYLLSLHWYSRYRTSRMTGLSLILVLSLFAKETCVLIPVMLLLYEVLIHETPFRDLPVKKWALLFAIPLLYFPIYAVLKDPVSMYEGSTGFSLYPKFDYIYTQAYYQGYLPFLFLNPVLQSIVHGVPGFTKPQMLTAVFGALLWIGVPFLLLFRRKRNQTALFLLAFYFIQYLPTNSFFQMVNPFAEYRLYLCMIPLAALFSLGVEFLVSKLPRHRFPNAATLIPAIVIAYLGIHTFAQVQIWKSEVKVYANAVKRYPFEESIYYSLAMSYLHIHDLENAFIYLVQTRIHAGFIDAPLSLQFYYVAGLYYKEKKFDRAWNVTEYMEKETARVPLPKQFYELRELIRKERNSKGEKG
jgi:hypothetical protein